MTTRRANGRLPLAVAAIAAAVLVATATLAYALGDPGSQAPNDDDLPAIATTVSVGGDGSGTSLEAAEPTAAVLPPVADDDDDPDADDDGHETVGPTIRIEEPDDEADDESDADSADDDHDSESDDGDDDETEDGPEHD